MKTPNTGDQHTTASLAHSFSEEDLNRFYAPAYHPNTDLSLEEQFATLYEAVIVKEEPPPPVFKRKSTKRRGHSTSKSRSTTSQASINNRSGSTTRPTNKRASRVKKEENNYPWTPGRSTSDSGTGAKNVTQHAYQGVGDYPWTPGRDTSDSGTGAKNVTQHAHQGVGFNIAESTDDNDNNNYEEIGSTGLYVEIAGVRSPVKNFFAPTDMLMKRQQESLARVEKTFEELKQNFVKTDEESERLISQPTPEPCLFPPSRQEERLSRITSELKLAYASAIVKEKEEERLRQEMENKTSKRFFDRNNSYRENMEQKNHIIQAQAQRSSLVRDINEQKTRRISREETLSEWMDKKWAATETVSERLRHLEDTVNKVFRDTETHMLHEASRARFLSLISREPIINDGPPTQPDHDYHAAPESRTMKNQEEQESTTPKKSFKATVVSNPFRRSTTHMEDDPPDAIPPSSSSDTPGAHHEKHSIRYHDEAISVGRTDEDEDDEETHQESKKSKDSNFPRITEVRNPFRANIRAHTDPPPFNEASNASRVLITRARDKPEDEDSGHIVALSAQEESPSLASQQYEIPSLAHGAVRCGSSISPYYSHNQQPINETRIKDIIMPEALRGQDTNKCAQGSTLMRKITDVRSARLNLSPPDLDKRAGSSSVLAQVAALEGRVGTQSGPKVFATEGRHTEHTRPVQEDPSVRAKGESHWMSTGAANSSTKASLFKSALWKDSDIMEQQGAAPVIKAYDEICDPFQRDIWADPKMVKQQSMPNLDKERVAELSVHLPNLAWPDPIKTKDLVEGRPRQCPTHVDPNIQARVTHANNPGLRPNNVRAGSSTNFVVSSSPPILPTPFQTKLPHMRREDQGAEKEEKVLVVDERNPLKKSLQDRGHGSDNRTLQEDPEDKDARADEEKQAPLEDRVPSEPSFRELKPHTGKEGVVADVGGSTNTNNSNNNNNNNNNPFLADMWTDPKVSTSPDLRLVFDVRLTTTLGASRSSVLLDASRSSVLGFNVRPGPDIVQLDPDTAKEVAELRNPFIEDENIWESVNRGVGRLPESSANPPEPVNEDVLGPEFKDKAGEILNPFAQRDDMWPDPHNNGLKKKQPKYSYRRYPVGPKNADEKNIDMKKLILPKNAHEEGVPKNNITAAEGGGKGLVPAPAAAPPVLPVPPIKQLIIPKQNMEHPCTSPSAGLSIESLDPTRLSMGDMTAGQSTPTLDDESLYLQRKDINHDEDINTQGVGLNSKVFLKRGYPHAEDLPSEGNTRSFEDPTNLPSDGEDIPKVPPSTSSYLQQRRSKLWPEPYIRHTQQEAAAPTTGSSDTQHEAAASPSIGSIETQLAAAPTTPVPRVRPPNMTDGKKVEGGGGNNPLPGGRLRLEPYDGEDRSASRGNNKLHHSQSYPDLTSLDRPNIKQLTGVTSPFPPHPVVSSYEPDNRWYAKNNHNHTLDPEWMEKRVGGTKEAYSRGFPNPRFQRHTYHLSPYNNVHQRTSHLSPYNNVLSRRTVSPYNNVHQRTSPLSPYNNVQQYKMMNNEGGGGSNQRQSTMMRGEDAHRHEYPGHFSPSMPPAPPNRSSVDSVPHVSNRLSFMGQAIPLRPSAWARNNIVPIPGTITKNRGAITVSVPNTGAPRESFSFTWV